MFYGYGIVNNHAPILKATVMKIGAAASPFLTSLYAVYKSESNANDSLGVYNGTAVGGLTYTAGKSGNAFTFNGTTSYVALPTNSMNFEQSFSVSAWVYSSVNLGNIYLPILSNVQADSWFNNPTGWWFEITGNDVRVYIFNHTNTYNVTTYAYAPGFNTSTWINVTFTRGVSGSTKIYINGTLLATNTNSMNPVYALGTTGNIVPTIGNLYVPSKTDYHYAPSGTKADEIAVWTEELTSTEITTLYNAGAGKFYPTF